MTTVPATIAGWTTADRVPGVAEETILAAGSISISQLPNKCLVTGTMLTGGTATPNQDINRVFSASDADTFGMPGSEGAIQCYVALAQNPNVPLFWAPAAEAGSATAGTVTVTVGGAWTTAGGSWAAQLDGDPFTNGILFNDTPTTVAANMAATYNGNPRRPCVATSAVGVVTFTSKSKGIRHLDHAFYLDTTKLPAGCTMVLAGGTALSSGGVRFTGATGAENITTLLNALFPSEYGYIGAAQYDSANAVLWKNQINAKAASTENRIDRVILGQTGTLSAAITAAQSGTGGNDFRMQFVWQLNAEWTPAMIAAAIASMRSSAEQLDPGAIFDDALVVGMPGQRTPSDVSQHTTLAAALLAGVTPLKTVNGQTLVCMSITSYSLFGSLPDYRCLQTYYEVIPDTIRKDIGLQYITGVKAKNPKVADDTAPNDPPRPAGVWTPLRANSFITGVLQTYEARSLILDVLLNPPNSGYDKIGQRIVAVIPTKVAPGNHQFGLSVRQIPS